MRERCCLRHGDGMRLRRGFDKNGAAFCVFKNELEGVTGEPRVDGHRYGTGAHGAKKYFQELDPVANDHADALTGFHAEFFDQAGDAVGAFIQLPIGDEALGAAIEVYYGDPIGKARDRVGKKIPKVAAAMVQLRVS